VYGYSISQEDGTALGITTEVAPRALGSSADTTATTVDWRLYLPAFAQHHVLAIRVAGGRSTGDPTVRRTFHLGGAQSNLSTTDFGRNAISLMRGFGIDTFAGSRVALLNAEYRWPLLRPQRGYGTWPIFFHTLHATGFADVGHAWDRQFEAKDLKTSLGAELSLRAVVGYSNVLVRALWLVVLGGNCRGDGARFDRQVVFSASSSRFASDVKGESGYSCTSRLNVC
jgi:hypothetical protein